MDFLNKLRNLAGSLLGQATQQVSTIPQQAQATGQLIQQGIQDRNIQLPQFQAPQAPKLNIQTPKLDFMAIYEQSRKPITTFQNELNRYANDTYQNYVAQPMQNYATNTFNTYKTLWNDQYGKYQLAEQRARENPMTPEQSQQMAMDWALSFSPAGVTKVGPKAISALESVATGKLKNLLFYGNELLKRGYTKEQINRIPYQEAQKIILKNIPPYLHESAYLSKQNIKSNVGNLIEEAQKMTKEKTKEFENIFAKWIGQRDTANLGGYESGSKFKDIPVKFGLDIIKAIENPNLKVNLEIQKWIAPIRKEYDELFKAAKQAGVNMNYVESYITHIWDKNPEEVKQLFKAAKQKFQFAKSREIPTYEEGIKLGLKPKYTHPAQILAEYGAKLQRVKADIQLFNELKQAKLISKENKIGYLPIQGPGFPKAVSKVDGKTVIGQWFAPKEVAQLINKIFSPVDNGLLGNALDFTHKASSKIQDITLSGGIPKTPFNAFTFANATKEVLSGVGGLPIAPIYSMKRIASPIVAAIRSITPGATNKFLKENIETIKKMRTRNIPLATTLDIDNLINKGIIKNHLGESVSDVWEKVVNEPTFKKFMPMLQIHMFNDIEQQAISKGKNPKEAADLAAKVVKNFYGIVSSATEAKRSQLSKDVVGTAFFAPKFREAMINFWVNNVKAISPVKVSEGKAALNNPLSTENRANTFFVMGAIAYYFLRDNVNQTFNNGKHMWENPPGKEDMVLIPLGDGYTLGDPFLSSIATMPRAAGKVVAHTLQGDLPQVTNDAKTFFSQLIKGPLDVMTNQNYFGQPVYDMNSSGKEKAMDIGAYLLGQYSHPLMRAGIEKVQDKSPDYQIASKALELPFRFYKTDNLNSSWYFSAQKEALKTLTPTQRKVYEDLHAGKELDENGLPADNKQNSMANAAKRLAHPEIVVVETNIALNTSQKTGQSIQPFYLLTPQQQRVVLWTQALPPGNADKKALQNANIDWLKPYWTANSQFFAQLNSNNQTTAPKPTDYVQQQMDQRNWNDPQVQSYLTANNEYTNQQRTLMGLPVLQSSFKPFSFSSVKKIALKKPAKVKVPKVSLKLKSKTLKLAKAKTSKVKLKVPKYNFKPLKYATAKDLAKGNYV